MFYIVLKLKFHLTTLKLKTVFLEWSSIHTERQPEFEEGSRAPTW
jgi:hypothetical protein